MNEQTDEVHIKISSDWFIFSTKNYSINLNSLLVSGQTKQSPAQTWLSVQPADCMSTLTTTYTSQLSITVMSPQSLLY